MLDLDYLREIAGTMRRNPLRTVLTAIGVFWGVLMLVAMVGFGNGLEKGARESMSGLVTNSLFIWGQRTSVPYLGQSPGRWIQLDLEDAETLTEIPGVAAIAPRASLGGRRGSGDVRRGERSGSFQVMGDTPVYLEMQPMPIRGRFINAIDIEERRKVAVIGARVVEVLFARGEEPLGQSIQIRGVEFLVVGVFETLASGERAAEHAATIYVPLTTFQRALTASSRIDYLVALSEPGVRAGAIESQLTDLLRMRHRVAPDDKQAIRSFNADAEVQKVVNLFRGISLLIYVVSTATLLAGLVGVSNIMMVSVRERTREIGIRKAIGATPRAVVGQVVLEAATLAAVAGYLGLVAGVALLEVVGRYMEASGDGGSRMFAPPEISLATAVGAALLVAVGGALSGLFPALSAAGIRTVIALRDE